MAQQLRNGDHLIYLDEYRRPHHALATQVWYTQLEETLAQFREGHGQSPAVNLVYVLGEEMRDTWGQQTAHQGSVQYGGDQTPPMLGRCWCFPDEVPIHDALTGEAVATK